MAENSGAERASRLRENNARSRGERRGTGFGGRTKGVHTLVPKIEEGN